MSWRSGKKNDDDLTMEDRAARGADAQARRFGRRGNDEAAAQWVDEAEFWEQRGGRRDRPAR